MKKTKYLEGANAFQELIDSMAGDIKTSIDEEIIKTLSSLTNTDPERMKTDIYERDSNGLAYHVWIAHYRLADTYVVHKSKLDRLLKENVVKTNRDGDNAIPHPVWADRYIYAKEFRYEPAKADDKPNQWVYDDPVGTTCIIYEA